MPVSARTCALLLAICAGAGCRAPEPPPTEQKPEPQAARTSEPQAHTELRDAIQQPIDKAKAVEQATQDAADQQRAQIEAAGG